MLGRTFAFLMTSTAPPAIASANYTQGDTLGGGQPIVLTGTWDVGSVIPQIDGVDLGAGTYTIDSATQITLTLPAHAAGATSITVRDAGGMSGGLAFEFWDPSQDATCTLFYDAAFNPYNAAAGTWTRRTGTDPTLASQGANTQGDGAGAPLFDGDGANEAGLKSTGGMNGYLSADGAFADKAGSIAAVFSSTTAATPTAPTNTPSIAGVINQGPVFILGAGQHDFGGGATHAIFGIGYDTNYLDMQVVASSGALHACVLREGNGGATTADLSVDGALSGAGYASLSATQGVPSVYTTGPIQCGVEYPGNSYIYQNFAGALKAFCILNAKASDTFVTKFYAWARQRFGVA